MPEEMSYHGAVERKPYSLPHGYAPNALTGSCCVDGAIGQVGSTTTVSPGSRMPFRLPLVVCQPLELLYDCTCASTTTLVLVDTSGGPATIFTVVDALAPSSSVTVRVTV